MKKLNQKRPQIDPKTLRKHSSIVEKTTETILVVGDRTQTDFGFEISGHTGKNFETLYMALLKGATTPVWQHEKKTRSFRVLSGSGYFEKYDSVDEAPVDPRPVFAGDEFVAEPGDIYRITCNSTKMELYVTQDSKYVANLKELRSVEQIASVMPEDLMAVSDYEKYLRVNGEALPRRSRSSRAVQQIAEMRGDRKVIDSVERDKARTDDFFRSEAGGINEMPIMHFSEEGAG
ncbi:hypothetical protein HC928_00235 [bacterium]|nr:hypothetical protein [bacterium]